MAKLQTILHDLPIYGDYGCSDADCTHPAVVRHPETGKFYCSGHAMQLAESHPAHMKDLREAANIRSYLLGMKQTCEFCADKPAERVCAGCEARICFDHYHLIPRTGAACPDCSEAMERTESEVRNV